jgi:hypothetical protein
LVDVFGSLHQFVKQSAFFLCLCDNYHLSTTFFSSLYSSFERSSNSFFR